MSPSALTTAPSTTSDRPGRDGVEWERCGRKGFIEPRKAMPDAACFANESLYMYLPNALLLIHNEQ